MSLSSRRDRKQKCLRTWVTLSGLSLNQQVGFIECGQQHGGEVDRPDAIIGFFQTDVLVDKGIPDVEQALLKEECPGYSGTDRRAG